MTDCTLCLLTNDRGASTELVFARHEGAVATLHADWAVPGHAMIVAAEHVENASQLSPRNASVFVDLYLRTEAALLRLPGVDRVILLKLGLAVPHLHWHLYPVAARTTRSEVFEAFSAPAEAPEKSGELARLASRLRLELGSLPTG